MKMSLTPVIELLHGVNHATLATHSTQLPGYPHASALPVVPDASHNPLLLISRLAEHTRNLQTDPRASLLICDSNGAGVLSGARLTLLGDFLPITAEPPLIERYLRYQPEAETYLGLGDFAFYRMLPQRARFIAGFGRMGWLEGENWQQLPALNAEQEATLHIRLASLLRADERLLGIDCFGIDLQQGEHRRRLSFAEPQTGDHIDAAATRLLQAR